MSRPRLDSDDAKIQPYAHHLLICTGSRCAPEESEALFLSLGQRLKAHGLDSGKLRVKRTRSNCFAVCKQGPIVVVYPAGVWYRLVSPQVMDRIIVEHLLGGIPVDEYVFHDARDHLQPGRRS